jgi:hypothetical protein
MTTNPYQGGQLVVDRTKIFSDIRFWLIALAIVRLYWITLPPLKFQHAWRQMAGYLMRNLRV